jgi:hypothetical protein
LKQPVERGIEISAIKISASDLARWGSVLILAVQFYFWIHLHEFRRKIDPNSPGRDVAWVGVYQSRIGALSVLLTALCITGCGRRNACLGIDHEVVTFAWLIGTLFPLRGSSFDSGVGDCDGRTHLETAQKFVLRRGKTLDRPQGIPPR